MMNVGEATWDAGFLDGGIGSLALTISQDLNLFQPRKENMIFLNLRESRNKKGYSYFLQDLKLF